MLCCAKCLHSGDIAARINVFISLLKLKPSDTTLVTEAGNVFAIAVDGSGVLLRNSCGIRVELTEVISSDAARVVAPSLPRLSAMASLVDGATALNIEGLWWAGATAWGATGGGGVAAT